VDGDDGARDTAIVLADVTAVRAHSQPLLFFRGGFGGFTDE